MSLETITSWSLQADAWKSFLAADFPLFRHYVENGYRFHLYLSQNLALESLPGFYEAQRTTEIANEVIRHNNT